MVGWLHYISIPWTLIINNENWRSNIDLAAAVSVFKSQRGNTIGLSRRHLWKTMKHEKSNRICFLCNLSVGVLYNNFKSYYCAELTGYDCLVRTFVLCSDLLTPFTRRFPDNPTVNRGKGGGLFLAPPTEWFADCRHQNRESSRSDWFLGIRDIKGSYVPKHTAQSSLGW